MKYDAPVPRFPAVTEVVDNIEQPVGFAVVGRRGDILRVRSTGRDLVLRYGRSIVCLFYIASGPPVPDDVIIDERLRPPP